MLDIGMMMCNKHYFMRQQKAILMTQGVRLRISII